MDGATVLFTLFAAGMALTLGDVAIAHWHLYRRLEPDPWRRGFEAALQYASLLGLWLGLWGLLQTAASLLAQDDAPLLPLLLSGLLTRLVNRFALKKPTRWKGKRPYLSRDRRLDALVQVLADRAAEVRAAPERRDAYLDRLYRDAHARLQVLSAYLREHKDRDWIALKPHQLAYHPRYNRLRLTTLYLLALSPAIVPYTLELLQPDLFANSADLTAIAGFVGTLLYGPLFDPGARDLLFALTVGLVLGLGLLLEFPRTRASAPGFAGLAILTIFGLIAAHYVESYVIRRTDTPLMQATEYVLAQLAHVEDGIEKFGLLGRMAVGSERIATVESLSAGIRETVLSLQSAAGSLFILPALLFWGGLSLAAIWELNLSEAADVTFRHRMRRPEL